MSPQFQRLCVRLLYATYIGVGVISVWSLFTMYLLEIFGTKSSWGAVAILVAGAICYRFLPPALDWLILTPWRLLSLMISGSTMFLFGLIQFHALGVPLDENVFNKIGSHALFAVTLAGVGNVLFWIGLFGWWFRWLYLKTYPHGH